MFTQQSHYTQEMVANMRSMVILFMYGQSLLYVDKRNGYYQVYLHMKQVEKGKLKDMEKFCSKRDKTTSHKSDA